METSFFGLIPKEGCLMLDLSKVSFFVMKAFHSLRRVFDKLGFL
jgi:hypothetical protein